MAGTAPGAASPLPEVLRRDATRTPLHGLMREYLETFLARFEDEHGGRRLPSYVERELRAFLACGDPTRGFCRIHCPSCASDLLLPFSCKGRGFCPSCGGRRMAEVAMHLTDNVLPFVPVRQWVLSVPWALRLRLASDRGLCRDVARAFLRAVFASYRRRAQDEGVLDAVVVGDGDGDGEAKPPLRARAHPGAVNFVQRFGSPEAMNVHFHALALDGVHVTRGVGGRSQCHAAPLLTQDEVIYVQRDAVRRIERVLRSRGLLGEGFKFIEDGSDESDSLLPFVQAASMQSRVALGPESGRPVQTLRDHAAAAASAHVPVAAPDSLCHESHGFSLHAATRVERHDRDRLEKLCRYVARPALSQARLTVRGDGKVLWELRKPWRDGTRAFVFEPLTFLERLVAIMPHPREHQLTYHGTLLSQGHWHRRRRFAMRWCCARRQRERTRPAWKARTSARARSACSGRTSSNEYSGSMFCAAQGAADGGT